MNDKDASLLQRIIKQRATRLGVSEDEVIASATGRPQFLRAAEEHARTERVSAEEILNRDVVQLEASQYPGPDCIMPYELEAFRDPDLSRVPSERLQHARQCVYCSVLLPALQPDQVKFQQFVRSAELICAAPATAGQE
jgi:hypothetical protein